MQIATDVNINSAPSGALFLLYYAKMLCNGNYCGIIRGKKRQQRGEIPLKEALELVGVGRTRRYELSKEISCRA